MNDDHGSQSAERALARAYDEARGYLRGVCDDPAGVSIPQAEFRKRLGETLPETGEPADAVIAALVEAARGGIVPTAGGRFFGFVTGGSHPAGVAADWLTAAWDDAPGTPMAAPFACAVDGVVADWVLELLDLPRDAGVGVVTGASAGNVVGVAAARHALLEREGWDVEADGLFGAPPITVLIGADAHPTVRLALRLTGFGASRVVEVATDQDGAMRADAFAAALNAAQGPALVCAQAGQVNTGAIDPFAEIAPACRERGAWLHVDGAFGLWGRLVERARPRLEGVELANSWSADSHKFLNTPYDAGFAIVADAGVHVATMSATASYLPQEQGGRDPSHYVPELSRRGRATPIYATLRALGRAGVRDMVQGCCDHAARMRDLVTARDGVSCLNDVILNQAIFRFSAPGGDEAAADRITADVVARVVATGECWLQTAQWRGQTIMRLSVSSRATTQADIERSAAAILAAYDAALADAGALSG